MGERFNNSVLILLPSPFLSKNVRVKHTEVLLCMLFHLGLELGISFQGRTWVEDIREQGAENYM
jgi:hypothetical protein